MAALIAVAVVMAVMAGVVLGAYIKICLAIRRDDKTYGSLRFEASDPSAQSARSLVGMTSSRWD